MAVDATYKIMLEQRPVIPVGTVDSDNHFHDVAMAIISTEKERQGIRGTRIIRGSA